MPETTPLIKAALNLRGGAGFDVYYNKAVRHAFETEGEDLTQKFKRIYRTGFY